MATLKESNRLSLWAVIAGNGMLLAFMLKLDLLGLVQEPDVALLLKVVPVGLSIVLPRMLSRAVPRRLKHALVYGRTERAEPSYRMVELGHADNLVDMGELEKANGGPLPVDLDAQHALWSKWYRQVEDKPPVLDAHGDFQFFRDWVAIGVILMLLLTAVVFVQSGWLYGLGYIVAHVAQYLVAGALARSAGSTMVTCCRLTGSA